ncbi:MAG: hypothetical protein II705_07445, partial [Clostridia bacterium]|nr:hypothetical protein [Clostridia bacterium]
TEQVSMLESPEMFGSLLLDPNNNWIKLSQDGKKRKTGMPVCQIRQQSFNSPSVYKEAFRSPRHSRGISFSVTVSMLPAAKVLLTLPLRSKSQNSDKKAPEIMPSGAFFSI